jgi:hypothetical protein
MKRLIRKLWVFLLLAPGSAFAATTNPNLDPEAYKPMIQIPGFEGFSKVTTDAANSTAVQVPYIGEYIGALYKFSIGAGAIVAAFMITVGGFQYVTAGAIPKNLSAAKQRITNALVGLLLLIGSYVVLYSLNPDLVAMKSISLLKVAPIIIPVDEAAEVNDGAGDGTPPPAGGQVVNGTLCRGISSYNYANRGPNATGYLRNDAANDFKKALTDAAEKGIPVHINADIRLPALQQMFRSRWIAKAQCACAMPSYASTNARNCSATEVKDSLIANCSTQEGLDAYKASYQSTWHTAYDSVRPADKPGNSAHEKGLAVDMDVAGLTDTQYKDLLIAMEAHGFSMLGRSTNGHSYDSTNIPADWKDASVWNEHHHFDYGSKSDISSTAVVTCSSNQPSDGSSSNSLNKM